MNRCKRFLRKVFSPSVLRSKETIEDRTPRLPQKEEAKVLQFASEKAVIFEALEDKFNTYGKSERVLIKINLNTADAFPASTSPQILRIVLEALHHAGLSKVFVGDCSSNTHLPTRKVVKHTPILQAIGALAQFLYFDEERWVHVPIQGMYLSSITLPACVYQMDRILYLANMKTHYLADFSMGMKLAVGFMHPLERMELHHDHLKEKIVEIALAIRPDVTLIDAERAMITGGPAQGRVESLNRFLLGHSVVHTDLAAYLLLFQLKKAHNIIENFSLNPLEMQQFSHAKRLGLL